MRKITIILLTAIIFSNCENFKRNREKNKLDKYKRTELNKNIRNDTIFLNLVFGMTQVEVRNHLDNLEKEKKLQINRNGNYYYTFNFGENEILKFGKAIFKPEYYDNKLYKLSIGVDSDNIISSPELMKLQLAGLYMKKYGFNYFKIKSSITDKDSFIWIDGNREIKIVEAIYEDARIFYTDLIMEKKAEKEKVIKAEINEQKINQDI